MILNLQLVSYISEDENLKENWKYGQIFVTTEFEL